MSKWISFHELLNSLDIEKFEVIEYLKEGLQPYAKVSGRPIDCPSFCHLGPVYESISKTGSEILAQAESFGGELNEFEQLSIAWGKKAGEELKVIKRDDPHFVSWRWIAELSDDDYKKLFSYLDEAIFKSDDALEFNKNRKQLPKVENYETTYQKVFPCQPDTKWENIKITLIEDEVVRVETPQGGGRFSYHQLGMSDKRTGNKPTMLWELFKLFAKTQGYIPRTNDKYVPTLADTTKRLNRHLQTIFNIHESIFTGKYKSEKGYRTKIYFSDQTIAD
jgi:hypothetical protein